MVLEGMKQWVVVVVSLLLGEQTKGQQTGQQKGQEDLEGEKNLR